LSLFIYEFNLCGLKSADRFEPSADELLTSLAYKLIYLRIVGSGFNMAIPVKLIS
jgi:hypothetical protein